MLQLRNIVVIGVLGVVIFVAGIMVGRALERHSRPAQTAVAESPAAGSEPGAREVIQVADLPAADGTATPEPQAPAVDGTVVSELSSTADGNAEEPKSSPADRAAADPAPPDKDVQLTFYTSLTAAQQPPVSLPVMAPEGGEKKSSVEKKRQPGSAQTAAGAETLTGTGPAAAVTPPPAGAIHESSRQAQPAPETAPAAGTIILQAGSFSREGAARLLRQRLETAGYAPVVVESADIPGKGTWYRVRITGIASREAAEVLRRRLADREGLQTMIVSR
ncbi:MAG: SPOR domain-containing protein [Deltaproteobacteria bacterium]|nr:SPOR domain-containing protein [Candidatus Anaeroferrophillacea bacterium]